MSKTNDWSDEFSREMNAPSSKAWRNANFIKWREHHHAGDMMMKAVKRKQGRSRKQIDHWCAEYERTLNAISMPPEIV